MTESQAEKIILLLESIDRRLKNVTEGDMTVDVTVTNNRDDAIPTYVPTEY